MSTLVNQNGAPLNGENGEGLTPTQIELLATTNKDTTNEEQLEMDFKDLEASEESVPQPIELENEQISLEDQFDMWLTNPFTTPENETNKNKSKKNGYSQTLIFLQPFVYRRTYKSGMVDVRGLSYQDIPFNIWKKPNQHKDKNQRLFFLADSWFKLSDNPAWFHWKENEHNPQMKSAEPSKKVNKFKELLDRYGYALNKFTLTNPEYIIHTPLELIESSEVANKMKEMLIEAQA